MTFFSNCTGMAAIVLRRADVADHHEDLVLVDQLLRRQHGLLGVVAESSTSSLILRPWMPPCSLISSTRSMHAVAGLFAVAGQRAGQVLDGAEHDFVLLTPWLWALGGRRSARQAKGQGGQARRRREAPGVSGKGLLFHGTSSPLRTRATQRYMASICGAYFFSTSLRLSFMVGVSSSSSALSWVSSRKNFLDLLDAGELLVHAVDLALDQRLHLGARVRLA
jgi:hypothetical protein